jgi:hypothetical protein
LAIDRSEASFTRETLVPLLKAAGRTGILVGGQALAVWVDYFGVGPSLGTDEDAVITRDTDFLGDRALVERVAKVLPAKPLFPPRRALTALVGQVQIPRPGGTFLNVDVIHKVVGIDAKAIRKRAVKFEFAEGGETIRFSVMHPLDVLRSRLANLAKVPDKQTPESVRQVRLAIEVARHYIARTTEEGDPADGQKRALKAIEVVAKLARSAAGRNARDKFGLDFLEAIPEDRITAEKFRKERWPRLLEQVGKRRARR